MTLSSEEYWEDRTAEFAEGKTHWRQPPGFVFASIPIPTLRGKRRVVVTPSGVGYRWFVSDSTQLSNPGGCNKYGEGWSFRYGDALASGERVALEVPA